MSENILGKPEGFAPVFDRKPGKDKEITHYCPGCGHGRIHKVVAEAMETLDIVDRSIFVSPVGCSVFGYYYFDCGNLQAAHGRAPAVGTAAARCNPESIVISYQGDGDLAAIGTAEIIHAANRGENMTVIFVNNTIYGMTGGQMAPTTLQGQKTSTSPTGRNNQEMGFPMKMCEIISTLDAPVYVERVTVSDSKGVLKARRAVQKALKSQVDGLGFSFVEILSSCPVGWKQSPIDANKRLKAEVEPYFPVKCFKDETATRPAKTKQAPFPTEEDILTLLDVKNEMKIFEAPKDFVKNFKEQRLRISGFGGQGVLLAGVTLSQLAMEHKLNATWIPSYGPEMRGGTANCHVTLSGEQIGTPVVEKPNVLIAMNGPSLEEFESIVEAGGIILVNSSLITQKVTRTDVTAYYIPMSEIAEAEGLIAAANMAAVASYLTLTKTMEIEKLIELMKHAFKKKNLLEQNVKIMRKAEEYIKSHY